MKPDKPMNLITFRLPDHVIDDFQRGGSVLWFPRLPGARPRLPSRMVCASTEPSSKRSTPKIAPARNSPEGSWRMVGPSRLPNEAAPGIRAERKTDQRKDDVGTVEKPAPR
jgi:hypothetical protein